MGIIKKQSIKGAIYAYIGVIIGFINTGLIFPKILLTEQIGLLNILISYSLVFSQLASLGFNNATTRLFTYFRDFENKHNGFLFLSLSVTFLGFLLSFILFIIIKPVLITNTAETTSLFNDNIFYIIPLTFFTLFFNNLDNYYKVLFNAVIGTFLKEFFIRILILIIIILYYLNILNFNQFLIFYVSSYCFPAIILVISLIKEKQFNLYPNLKFINKELRKALINVSLFAIISGFAGIAIANIDKIMINQLNGLSDTGIYSIAFYFGTLIIIPSRSLLKISSTFIADSWKTNDLKTIRTIYNKSAINQMAIGLLIFIGLVANLNNVFKILPEPYSKGEFVILFIGLAFLTDMSTGVAQQIVSTSKYYRYQSYFMFALISLIIITNLYFIPRYGITGAAFASLLSKVVINIIRILFIYKKFKLYPYNIKFVFTILIGIISYMISSLIPELRNIYLDIILRIGTISIIFILLAYILNISEEINSKVFNIFNIIFHKIINK